MSRVALVLTVGGSHEPLLAAIDNVQPDFVLFVCSEDDPVTGNSGSYTQILSEGKIIKANFSDAKPTLENIPRQAGIADENYRVIQVPSDEIDNAYRAVSVELKTLVNDYTRIVCDYTGGTKSMSSSLVLAAVENENVEVQVVAGARNNLRKVDTLFQSVQVANVGKTRFTDSLNKALRNWEKHNYGVALSQLNQLKASNKEDVASLMLAKVVSQAFASWDVFNHVEAKNLLGNISKKLGEEHRVYLKQIGMLCSDSSVTVPNRILDLWLNAERCATRERFDDATARVYRLMEWCSQWLLLHHKNIDTADISETDIPAEIAIPYNSRKKRYMASLVQSWDLASATCGDDIATFWKDNKEGVIDFLEVRNNSILAHGYEPITEQQWAVLNTFVSEKLMPLMLVQFKPLKLQNMPVQLPTRWQK